MRLDPKVERGSEPNMMNGVMGAMGWVLDKGGSAIDFLARGIADDWEAVSGYNFLDERRR